MNRALTSVGALVFAASCATAAGPADGADGGPRSDAGRARRDSAVLPIDAATVDARPADASVAGAACVGNVDERDLDWTLRVDDRDRSAAVHLPPAYDGRAPLPIVVSLHALGSSANVQATYTGLEATADEQGFVLVHPSGVGGSWNAGSCCGTAQTANVDDVAFIAALLDRIEAELCIVRERVYFTGMSNGGFMSHRLACELSHRIAAIASVAGIDATAECAPSRPVPVLQIHGTADTVVPYSGAQRTVAAWRERNGCDDEGTVVLEERGVSCERFGNCRNGGEVEFCTLTAGGHIWPGGLASISPLDANSVVWEFLARQRLD